MREIHDMGIDIDIHWESELAELLERLAATQQELLSLLSTKHDLLLKRDHQGLAALAPQEASLSAELQSMSTISASTCSIARPKKVCLLIAFNR